MAARWLIEFSRTSSSSRPALRGFAIDQPPTPTLDDDEQDAVVAAGD
jgi:hypothetical protein